jgi:hypothetical protein
VKHFLRWDERLRWHHFLPVPRKQQGLGRNACTLEPVEADTSAIGGSKFRVGKVKRASLFHFEWFADVDSSRRASRESVGEKSLGKSPQKTRDKGRYQAIFDCSLTTLGLSALGRPE